MRLGSGLFFFCKQKTAYEMRISDWSSDVCSSDLVVDWLCAGERVGAVDVHRTGAAHTFAAGAPESEGCIHLVLDLDKRVQDHRRAAVEIDFVSIHPRVIPDIGIPAVDPEALDALGADRCVMGFTLTQPGIRRKCKPGHQRFSKAIGGEHPTLNRHELLGKWSR